MKYVILGYSGSGKSTFAKKLSSKLNIEATHLDKLYFNPDWNEVEPELFESRIQNILVEDNWIIEGNYSRYGKNRINDASIIYIFNFNRVKCLFNLIKRRIKYNKKVRDSVPEGCYEKLDLKFIKYVMITARNNNRKLHYKSLINDNNKTVIVFKNHRQVNKYLTSLV